MDNASKALIMAGAILISVAIVGIGIYIFTTANALTDDAVGQIDSLAVSAVNARIENYLGSNVRGSSVIQLERELDVLNAQDAMPTDITKNGFSGIKANSRYNVTATYDNTTGYITAVTVAGTGTGTGAGGGEG